MIHFLIRISSSLTYSAYVLGLGPAHVIKTKEIVQDGCKSNARFLIRALVWKTMTPRVYFSFGEKCHHRLLVNAYKKGVLNL